MYCILLSNQSDYWSKLTYKVFYVLELEKGTQRNQSQVLCTVATETSVIRKQLKVYEKLAHGLLFSHISSCQLPVVLMTV